MRKEEGELARRYRRVPLAASVTLVVEEGGKKLYLEAMTVDISPGGIGLYVGRHLPEDTVAEVIEIRFQASFERITSETLKGKVIFSSYIEKFYFIGIEFLEELNPESQPELYNRIQGIVRSG
jgi:c-di-GMP-binding flagellar brake protein YcgR